MGLYDWMTPDEKQMMMSNQLIGLGAGLLQNSGYSPVRQTTGQALGSGLAGMMGAAKSSMGDIQDKRKMELQANMMKNRDMLLGGIGTDLEYIKRLFEERMKQEQGQKQPGAPESPYINSPEYGGY